MVEDNGKQTQLDYHENNIKELWDTLNKLREDGTRPCSVTQKRVEILEQMHHETREDIREFKSETKLQLGNITGELQTIGKKIIYASAFIAGVMSTIIFILRYS